MIFHVYEVTTTVEIEAESQGEALSIIEERLKRSILPTESRYMSVKSASVKLAHLNQKKKGAR